MNLLSVIILAGGLAFFLYGMNVMSSGLEKMAGGKLEGALRRLTSNPFKSLMLGMSVTAVIQSSSALTVMLVGLVNSGIMQIGQTVGIIMGSNIGTTITAWLLSMIEIETDNVWLKLLKPDYFSLIFALVGVLLIMASKSEKKKDAGTIMIGFAVLMYGMKLMSSAVEPLADSPKFASVLTAFENPVLGILMGAVFTAVIQSSSASVGILQALSLTGSISYGVAIPIIMGQNIGTCITALISGIGVNRNAKKVGVIHIAFNLIGTLIWTAIFYIVNAFVNFAFIELPIGAVGIATVHSIFNILTTALLLPFGKYLVMLANRILPDKETAEKKELLDERLLAAPSIAVLECNNITMEMSELANKMISSSLSLMTDYDPKLAAEIAGSEERLDYLEDRLSAYLMKISAKPISDENNRTVSKMFHILSDFERMGDHAVGIAEVAKELFDKKISFTDKAKKEVAVLTECVLDITERTAEVYRNNDIKNAFYVEPLEQVVDGLAAKMRSSHIRRLQSGECTIELGFILTDLITHLQRISDHCSNVAVAVVETTRDSFDSHEYLHSLKNDSDEFSKIYREFAGKYRIEA